jgi:hypothetical protein
MELNNMVTTKTTWHAIIQELNGTKTEKTIAHEDALAVMATVLDCEFAVKAVSLDNSGVVRVCAMGRDGRYGILTSTTPPPTSQIVDLVQRKLGELPVEWVEMWYEYRKSLELS